MSQLKTQIEGLLFIVGEEGISDESIAETLAVSLFDVQQTISELQKHYQQHQSALMILQVAGVYKLTTISDLYPVLTRYLSLKSTRSLSQSALETLAIIAYKQPITRTEIENLRGVSSELMLKKLQAMDLITVYGRADTPGRPILYQVTNEFLDVFHLVTLDDLPKWEQISLQDTDELYG